MHRIDENTYIDNTLVTCAEYQLFIDEMREQGKYYQPDHWTSYQFPEGKAREPILGVRFSDAKNFCEWLTNKYGKTWMFRVPSISESGTNIQGPEFSWRFGYWVSEGAFVTRNTSDPYPNYRRLSETSIGIIENAFKEIEKDVNSISYISAIQSRLYSALSKNDKRNPSVQARISSCLPLDIERYFIPEDLLADAINARLNLQNIRKDIQHNKQLLNFNFKEAINHALAYTLSDDNYLIKSYTALYENIAKREPKLFQISAQLNQSNLANLKKAVILSMVHDLFIYFCIDILTLSERIAGRSPAFEGIRLVKERIR